MPIIFPAEGNILHFVQTLQKLVVFVRDENIAEEQRTAERERENEHDFEVLSRRIKVGCAHQTAGADAEEIMMTTYRLMKAIVDGKVPVVSSRKQRGEPVDLWQESKTARMSVLAPRRLVENVREEIARRKREMQPLPEGFEEGVDESGWHLPKVDCAPTCQRKQRRHVRRLNPPRFVMYSSSTTAISLPEQPLPANADPR